IEFDGEKKMKDQWFLGNYNQTALASVKLPKQVSLFDCTLREGEQIHGVAFTNEEKIDISKMLDKVGVDTIEAGFPVNSRPELKIVKQINELGLKAKVIGLSRALVPDVEACIEAGLDHIHIFISASAVHLKYQVRKDYDQVLELASKAITMANNAGLKIVFSPMDSTRTQFDDLVKICQRAEELGAHTINIADTVGVLSPTSTKMLIGQLRPLLKGQISMHCHNDFGLAVANTLAGVEAGATEAQVTVTGIGERAGNAALEQVVIGLEGLYGIKTNINKQYLTEMARRLQDVAQVDLSPYYPVVGGNAFSHEAGIHAQGVMNKPRTFEPYRPEMVGQTRRIVIGKHSGHNSIEATLKQLGYSDLNKENLTSIISYIKETAARKKRIYEEDIRAIVNDVIGESSEFEPIIKLDELTVVTGNHITPTATVVLKVNDKVESHSARGNGPIDASVSAIKKIISEFQPIRLKEYKLHAITGGTDALAHTSVAVEDSDHNEFKGSSANTDVIYSSVEAIIRAANKALHHQRVSKKHPKKK
ncbi:MAG: 2-isopropylmalate synthase, partial [Candidatus Ranarchaeia archaeon]